MVSPDPDLFPPELEELVVEIARDPRSSLLRVERPRRPAALFDPQTPLSPRTPGLTSAEREILTVYREELAALLLQRWATEVTLRPPKGQFVLRASGARDRGERGTDVCDAGSEELLGMWREEHPDERLTKALMDDSLALDSQQLTILVTNAVHLLPSSRSRIFLVIDHTRTGQYRTAITVLRRLFAVEYRPDLRSHLWDALATAHGDEWNPRDLVEWYSKASQSLNPRIDPLAIWLIMATNHGYLGSARQAAEILDDIVTPEDPRVALHVEHQLRTRREGRWAPRPRRRADLEAMLESVGPTSRRILHVLE